MMTLIVGIGGSAGSGSLSEAALRYCLAPASDAGATTRVFAGAGPAAAAHTVTTLRGVAHALRGWPTPIVDCATAFAAGSARLVVA
jgi:hypothetical protein